MAKAASTEEKPREVLDAGADEGELPAPAKARAKRLLTFGIFQAVLQHVLALQSEVTLFAEASGGDQGATARALATSTGISGMAGLFLNQIGGKLSDSLGRKLGFLMGPVVNILAASLLLRNPKSLPVLTAVRVLKSIFITFSGTVMCSASLADIASGTELSLMHTTIQIAVGIAVVAGPYIESLLLKVTRGNPLSAYKAMIVFSIIQLINNGMMLPETLAPSKRTDLKAFFQSLASLNPVAFLKVYAGKNARLKKLLTIQTLQYCVDGKVTSDLFQMWSRNDLKWPANVSRDFVAFWGAAVTAGSAIVHPRLLKRLSTFTYSTVGNMFVGAGLCMHGLAKNGLFMWAGVPFLIPGVNGGSAHAIKALSVDIAVKDGYGNGEFSAWSNNMRALIQSIQIVLLGRWYARCGEKGIYPGTAWFLAGFVGAGLPQVLMMCMPASDFEPLKKTPSGNDGKDA